ncbi:MAG: SRPBCC family protein [Myxococcota bacterium]|nr:SRPBCC family protein [Myxococcota bacterium]
MSQQRLVVEQEIAASPERVWAAINDHEGMSRWLDARVSVLARRDGTAIGTVRRIRARGIVVDEEVVYADAPAEGRPGRLVYRIVRGAPFRFHRGEMLVERIAGDRSRLTWDVVLASDIPGVARLGALALRPALRAGLRKLDRLLAA